MKKILLISSFLICTQGISQNIDYAVLNSFLEKHVSEKGLVDYKFISSDELNATLNQFIKVTPKQDWTKEEKLSYWINAYNIFTIKLIVDNYPIKSIKNIKQPWDKKFIPIGDELLSLNHIEHEILRKMSEPRMHFAIVCASYSCPKLQSQAFVAEKLDEQLTKVTKEFLADKNRNKISANSIEISKIFDWFSKDFTQNGSLIDFLNQYSNIHISPNAKKRYKDYNWALNE